MSHQDLTTQEISSLHPDSGKRKTRWNAKDLQGQTFGEWTVIEPDLDRVGSNLYWFCLCSCGRRFSVMGSRLRNGKSPWCRPCGDKKKRRPPSVDLSGQRYGSWIVEALSHRNRRGLKVWLCRCDCGRTGKFRTYELHSGTRKCCRVCARKKSIRLADCLLWNNLKRNARERNLEVTITKEWVLALLKRQNNRCALSGLPIEIAESNKGQKRRKETTASVDRIDSRKGYTPDNVQWVHKTINMMKQNLTDASFVKFCIAVAKHASKCGVSSKDESELDQPSLFPI
jgi:hypothetical protein